MSTLKAPLADDELVNVVVVAPFQTSLAGVVFGPGETASVPAAIAAAWIVYGWAEPAE